MSSGGMMLVKCVYRMYKYKSIIIRATRTKRVATSPLVLTWCRPERFTLYTSPPSRKVHVVNERSKRKKSLLFDDINLYHRYTSYQSVLSQPIFRILYKEVYHVLFYFGSGNITGHVSLSPP